MSFSFDFVKSQSESALERFAVENGKRSGGRGSGRPRRISLKNTLFRRNDGSAAFEMGQFQKQNALRGTPGERRVLSPCSRRVPPRARTSGRSIERGDAWHRSRLLVI